MRGNRGPVLKVITHSMKILSSEKTAECSKVCLQYWVTWFQHFQYPYNTTGFCYPNRKKWDIIKKKAMNIPTIPDRGVTQLKRPKA